MVVSRNVRSCTRQVGTHLDVFSEELHALVVLLITRPFAAIHFDLTRPCHGIRGLFCEVFDPVNVVATNLFALLSVIDVETGDGRGDGEKDKPVPGGQLWTFAEPCWGDASVLESRPYSRLVRTVHASGKISDVQIGKP